MFPLFCFFVVVTAVDEQNAQTSASTSSLAEAIVTVAASAAGEVVTTSTARIEEELEPVQGICTSHTGLMLSQSYNHLVIR